MEDMVFEMEKGPKSNLSINGCQKSPYFNFYNSVQLGSRTSPVGYNDSEKQEIKLINEKVITNKQDKYFKQTSDGMGFYTDDPRQFDAARAIKIVTDTVPINGKVPLKDIYTNNDVRSYNYHNNPYENISDGQITYYVDKSISGAFYRPVYSQIGKETASLFQDPMGSMKPEYNRTLTYQNLYEPNCGFRAIQDSQYFREDLIALQQRKHNQQKWSARWEVDYSS